MNGLSVIYPELFLAAAGLILLLLSAWRGDKGQGLLSVLCAGALGLTAVLVGLNTDQGQSFQNMVIADGYTRYLHILLLVASALALALAPSYLTTTQSAKAEYAPLVLFATLGMMIMVAAHDLLAVYVGLELQNLALYVLASFRRDDARSSEAGLKYFTLGAMSSGILLFGLSLVYGATGLTDFWQLAATMSGAQAQGPGLAIGLAFVVAGFAFKISAVPFHMWTPDVYEGAPTPVTAFLASAPKIAALALVSRVLAEPFAHASFVWQPLLIVLAAASMVLGGLGGLWQSNLKRLLAYSAIVNVGTMLVGLVALRKGGVSLAGLEGILIYLALYFAGTLAVFSALLCLRRGGQPVEAIADLAGLSKRHPALALALAAGLFSLAGVPPLAGFFGKYFVLLAAVKSGLVWLAVLGVLASVVAAAYYLRVIKVMYFDAPEGMPVEVVSDRALQAAVALAGLAVGLFILMPQPLLDAARRAAESLLNV